MDSSLGNNEQGWQILFQGLQELISFTRGIKVDLGIKGVADGLFPACIFKDLRDFAANSNEVFPFSILALSRYSSWSFGHSSISTLSGAPAGFS